MKAETSSFVAFLLSAFRFLFCDSSAMSADYDGAWKEFLEIYLRPFLEFCFSRAASRVDWSQPVIFLDKELQEVVRDSELGKLRADKLIRVGCLAGQEEWVLIHVEVQSQPDEGL